MDTTRGTLIILLIRRGQGMYNLCVVEQSLPRYYCSPGSIVLCVLYIMLNMDVKHEKSAVSLVGFCLMLSRYDEIISFFLYTSKIQILIRQRVGLFIHIFNASKINRTRN